MSLQRVFLSKAFVALLAVFCQPIQLHAQCDTENRAPGEGRLAFDVQITDASHIVARIRTEKDFLERYLVEDICFEVAFYDSQQNNLAVRTFYFLSGTGQSSLVRGNDCHERRFRHSVSGSARAIARNLCYTLIHRTTHMAGPIDAIEKASSDFSDAGTKKEVYPEGDEQ
jgi:hypothetical protein